MTRQDGPVTTTTVAWRPIGAVCAGLASVLLVTSARYGYHRDELYFLACGRHLAWGYPDQPPLTPLLARLMDDIGRGSLTVFRLPALLAATGVSLLTGLTARELGGGPFAQGLATLTAAAGTFVLVSGHLLATSTIDLAVWVCITWLVTRILRTGDERLWLAVGAVAGLGMLNKQLVVVLLLGLAVGVLMTPRLRPAVRSRWLWAGVAVTVLAWAPVLAWQASHGWPQLTLAGQIRDEYGTPGARAVFAAQQLVLFSIGATVLWVIGLVRVWRDPEGSGLRVLGWVSVVVLGVFAVTAGQGYYPGGIYPALIAAGAVTVEGYRRLRGRPRWALVGTVAATSALLVPAALPVLPPATLGSTVWAGIGEQQREMVGWPHLVDLVGQAYRSIPAQQRSRAGIFTANYGEAGAVDRFGPALGLPRAWSGHNGYGLWGPPPSDVSPVVVVWEGGPPDGRFTGCRRTARVTAPVRNEESDRASVYVCDGPVDGWAAAWPRLAHLSS
jgi:4-amino-4-deoxy-L-arabinose transferase-like glycosyltransferase